MIKLTAQDYKDHCPSCNKSIYFDLTKDGMSKGYWCQLYRIMIQFNKDGGSHVCVPGKEYTECAILKKKFLNKKLKKCQFGVL